MAANKEEIIHCPIGKWYFKRMTLLGLLLIGFGCWFLYDGLVGYPRGAFKAIAFEAFNAGADKTTWDEYSSSDTANFSKAELDEEQLEAVKKAYRAGGERSTWADFARKKKFHDTFEPGVGTKTRPLFDAFQAGGGIASAEEVEAGWLSFAEANGLPADPVAAEDEVAIAIKNAFRDATKPRDWALYAAENGLPSKEPHFHGKSDIIEQYVFGGGCAVAGLVVLVLMLTNRNCSISADADAYHPKPSLKVPFADIFRIDTRKWRRKGLAYAYYRSADGAEKKVAVDDLKFVGAQKILDRMVENFAGELVEEVVEDDDDGAGEDDKGGADSAAETVQENAGNGK